MSIICRIGTKLKTTVMGGAIIIGVSQIISRLIGLLRERMLASTFGAGDVLDVYYAAFKIPDFVFNIIVLGALSSAFIPVFLGIRQKEKDKPEKEKECWKITNTLLNTILIILVVAGILVYIFADQLTPLLAYGFPPDKQQQTADLMRIMFLGVIFFGISNIFSGILNSFRRFVAYSVAPILYNVGIITGIIYFVPLLGIKGLAWGVVLGAFLHFLVQLPAVLRVGFNYRSILDLKSYPFKKIITLMLPRSFGLGISQINMLIMTALASTLAMGSVAVYNLANNLQHFAISVIGVSLSIAVFPVFSQAFAENKQELFKIHFSKTFRRVLFFIVPVSIAILLLRAQIVRLVLGTGAFDWEDTYLTAQALGYFSISLFAQSLIPLLARSFYANQDTKTPVIISTISVIINVVLALVLVDYYGVTGLVLAFSIASIINMLLLFLTLRLRLGNLDDDRIINSILKIILVSLLAGVIIQVLKYVIAPLVDMHTFVGVFLQAIGAALGGGLVYLVLACIGKFDEVDLVIDFLKKAKRQILNGNNK